MFTVQPKCQGQVEFVPVTLNILGTTSKPNTGIPHVFIAKVNAKMAITFIIIPADA
jgi:hypothetical protein